MSKQKHEPHLRVTRWHLTNLIGLSLSIQFMQMLARSVQGFRFHHRDPCYRYKARILRRLVTRCWALSVSLLLSLPSSSPLPSLSTDPSIHFVRSVDWLSLTLRFLHSFLLLLFSLSFPCPFIYIFFFWLSPSFSFSRRAALIPVASSSFLNTQSSISNAASDQHMLCLLTVDQRVLHLNYPLAHTFESTSPHCVTALWTNHTSLFVII